VIFGALTKPDLKGLLDLSPREYAMLAPIAAVVLWMGIAPNIFIDPVRAPVGRVLARLAAARPPVTLVVRAALPKVAIK
jgi:NADH-quinone oxidoreductase subunit M